MRYAVVAFLESKKSLRAVDMEFRPATAYFHCIPYCATFGVSCAGHLYIEDGTFFPKLPSSLCIIDVPAHPHIPEMHARIRTVVQRFPDASFEKILHPFGPLPGNPTEVWRLSLGDNGILAPLNECARYGYSPIAEHRDAFYAIRDRFQVIQRFWWELSQEMLAFRREHGFGRFDLKARVHEVETAWKGN